MCGMNLCGPMFVWYERCARTHTGTPTGTPPCLAALGPYQTRLLQPSTATYRRAATQGQDGAWPGLLQRQVRACL